MLLTVMFNIDLFYFGITSGTSLAIFTFESLISSCLLLLLVILMNFLWSEGNYLEFFIINAAEFIFSFFCFGSRTVKMIINLNRLYTTIICDWMFWKAQNTLWASWRHLGYILGIPKLISLIQKGGGKFGQIRTTKANF